MSYRQSAEFDDVDVDYMSQAPRSSRGRGGAAGYNRNAVRVLRDSEVYLDQHRDRTPAFLRDGGRRPEPGPMMLRRREVETFDRQRSSSSRSSSRSHSPVLRVAERRIVTRARSESPTPLREERSRTRIIEAEHTVSPLRGGRRRSPSPAVRFVERRYRSERERREPSPQVVDHEHIRITERERGRSPERSPTPPTPPPAVIRAPTIEREVITHYRDVDHGVVRARQPSPVARPRTHDDDLRETDIDILLDKRHTDVDIRKTTRSRSRSRSRHGHGHSHHYYDDGAASSSQDDLRVHIERGGGAALRRSRSMMGRREGTHADYSMAGTVNGPSGGERVRVDTSWSRHGGGPSTGMALAPILRKRQEERSQERRLNVMVAERDTEVDVEQTTMTRRRRRNRSGSRPKAEAPRETWTEVSRNLVSREAIERLGYPYEETRHYFYLTMFVPSSAVSELMDLTEEIRRSRRRRAQEASRDFELQVEVDGDLVYHQPHRHHRPLMRGRRRSSGYLDERFRELDVSVDERRIRGGGYY